MAITINGSSNTITGLAVGGLPNGVVNTDMLAAGAVTAAKRGRGSMLQIIEASTNDRVETSSTSFVATNLTASITPNAGSNKILVQVSGDCNTNADDNELIMTVYRSIDGGSYSNLGNADFGFATARSNAERLHSGISIMFLDSPSSTAVVAYKVYIRKTSAGSGNVEFPAHSNCNKVFMHLTEIAA